MRAALRDARRALRRATTWEAWSAAASEHDRLTGADAWRDDDEHPAYDARSLRADIAALGELRARRDAEALAAALSETLYKHQVELASPALYDVALTGTKRLVERYLDACTEAMTWLATEDLPGLPPSAQLQRFEVAWRVYGRSALMLSGGATLGFHHLGVVKALFDRGLLPEVLCGASTGAMIAAGICARDDAEVAALFADTDQMRLDGLLPVGLRRFRESGAWLDPERLDAVLRHNIGDRTFAEARVHSGRALNISVSPTRSRQKPRLLSYLSAPDVLVASAALASSALPGLFPPVQLRMRDRAGDEVAYLDGERWVDGSLHGDLPKQRLSRLHNVNHFIVSQTNPHVVPFLARGGVGAVLGAVASAARTQGGLATDLARRAAPGALELAAQQLHQIVSQDYRGDIDIHPTFQPTLYRKVVSNPTRADLAGFIAEGQRSVWPLIPRIDADTRIGRAFIACLATLRRRARGAP